MKWSTIIWRQIAWDGKSKSGSATLDENELKCKSQSVLNQIGTWASVPQQRMRRRTLNEILPLSQIIYVIVKNNLKCIFFMSYWQRINFFSWIEQWKVNIYQMIFCVCRSNFMAAVCTFTKWLVGSAGCFFAYSLSHWWSRVCALWYFCSAVISCDSLYRFMTDFGSINFLIFLSYISCGSDLSGSVRNLYRISWDTPKLSGRGGKTLAHCREIGCSFGRLQFKLSQIALLSTSARILTAPGRW